MTSRDRVLAAFDHREPDRVPAWCGASPEFWDKAKRELRLDDEALRVRLGDDFRRVFAKYAGPEITLAEGVTSQTPFGVGRTGLGYGQPISHPLADATLEEVHEYPWPDPAWMDVSHIRAEAEAYGRQYAILGGDWSPFWHDLIDLLGMENFFIGNDFGGQRGPLLGEAMFRRFILPHLRRLVDLGHDYGLKVMLHCCGGFAELIPAMIEIGIDGLHAIQPCCRGMDLANLKADFGRQILFNGAIDSQHVLIDGTPATVREKTREVLDIMKPGGGYVAGASHDTILEETPLENVLAMFDAIREFGGY